MKRERIAIIGSGISGLTCAYLLHKQHDVTLFEANDYLGGHTHTVDVELGGKQYPVNTGFIVYNDWTYPNFIKLMNQLGVANEPSNMSFSVRCDRTGIEYNGTSLNSLFAQRMNLVRLSFLKMIRDILRFNKEAVADLQQGVIGSDTTLGQYLEQKRYSERFIEHYIVPMGAAIWSASERMMLSFPLQFFVRFFDNHGMLSVDERPQWRVISGGSRAYVDTMIAGFQQNIHLNTPVQRIQRDADGVTLTLADGEARFDQVIIATHSDQALKLLHDPSAAESDVLGAIPYQNNDVVLHTDTRLLPARKLAWAAWNYHLAEQRGEHATLTYNMNILQNLDAPETFCVTLNETDAIDPARIIAEYQYAHPVFTLAGMGAQQRYADIGGRRFRTHYCGAYWFNGFHEDGVNSALRVCEDFGVRL